MTQISIIEYYYIRLILLLMWTAAGSVTCQQSSLDEAPLACPCLWKHELGDYCSYRTYRVTLEGTIIATKCSGFVLFIIATKLCPKLLDYIYALCICSALARHHARHRLAWWRRAVHLETCGTEKWPPGTSLPCTLRPRRGPGPLVYLLRVGR